MSSYSWDSVVPCTDLRHTLSDGAKQPLKTTGPPPYFEPSGAFLFQNALKDSVGISLHTTSIEALCEGGKVAWEKKKKDEKSSASSMITVQKVQTHLMFALPHAQICKLRLFCETFMTREWQIVRWSCIFKDNEVLLGKTSFIWHLSGSAHILNSSFCLN